MRAFFQYLYQEHLIENNPADHLHPPKVEKKMPQILSVEEVDLLLRQPSDRTPKGLRDRAMLELHRAFRLAKDYWVIDGAIAAQNICLAAQELGLGAVWLGTWPQMDRVEAQQKLFGLPETIVPHSIIVLGYPEADITTPRESRYEDDRVHFEQW